MRKGRSEKLQGGRNHNLAYPLYKPRRGLYGRRQRLADDFPQASPRVGRLLQFAVKPIRGLLRLRESGRGKLLTCASFPPPFYICECRYVFLKHRGLILNCRSRRFRGRCHMPSAVESPIAERITPSICPAVTPIEVAIAIMEWTCLSPQVVIDCIRSFR